MEKSSQSSFLKSLAVAFGDGLLFGVAMKLAQGSPKARENGMTDLGPLAERLRKVEDQTSTIDKNSLTKFGEGLDGRVFDKVVVALEARLTEHVGHVDRRLAEIDAQVALDLKAVDAHTAAQSSAVEKAIQQIEAQVRDYVEAAQQSSAEQISGVDRKLSALQEALPAKFREIVEAVRQSMDARVALEMTELENRVSSRGVAPEHLQELQSNLRGEVEALSGRLSTEMRGLAEHQQNQTAPLQQALQQLETKLTTLREELPPKIRQIVEAVEASMDARISAGDRQAADRAASLEHALEALRTEMPSAGGFQQAIDENLRRHAEQVGALDQKLTVLQEELPPKIKAIVDAVRESLDARMAVELKGIEERHRGQIQQSETRYSEAQEQLRRQLAADSKTPALEQSVANLQADLHAIDARVAGNDSLVAERLAGLEQHAAQVTAGVAAELESLQSRHRTEIEQLEARLQAERAAEIHALEDRHRQHAEQFGALDQKLTVLQDELPHKIKAAGDSVQESLNARLAMELRGIEERHSAQIQRGDLDAMNARITGGLAAELESSQARHRTEIEQLEARLHGERTAENVPAQIDAAVAGLRQSLEATLAAEIHALEARAGDRAPDLEKALQYASLLEARIQALEQKLQQSAQETVDLAVERVWQSLEGRLQQRETHAPAAPVDVRPPVPGLRQKSTNAEQSVLDLIASLGQLFEKSAPRIAPDTPVSQVHAAPEPAEAKAVAAAQTEAEPVVVVQAEPEPVAAVQTEPEPVVAAQAAPEPVAAVHIPAPPEPPAPEPPAAEPEAEPAAFVPERIARRPEDAWEPVPAQAKAATTVTVEEAPEEAAAEPEPKPEDKPPVILFKPKEAGRKWRIPFVSTFMLMLAALAWLQF
jgi:hypothetical protein